MKLKIAIYFLIVTALCSAFLVPERKAIQHAYHSYNVVVAVAIGDLNKDNVPDSVVVTQDTMNVNAPYRLQIFFKNISGKYALVATANKAIDPQYPNGRDGWYSGSGFDTITISKNVLTISVQLLRGHFEHKFRYQHGNFELIGYTSVSSDGQGTMFSSDFNLSTGRYIGSQESYETDSVNSKTDKIIKIRPLPKLQDFSPYVNDLF